MHFIFKVYELLSNKYPLIVVFLHLVYFGLFIYHIHVSVFKLDHVYAKKIFHIFSVKYVLFLYNYIVCVLSRDTIDKLQNLIFKIHSVS